MGFASATEKRKGDQRLYQLRRYVVVSMAVCAAENIPEHQGLALLQLRVLCGGRGWGAGAQGPGGRQRCLNVLGNSRHSAHLVLLSFD